MIRPIVLLCCAALAASCTRDPQDAARRFVERADRFAQAGRDDAALIEYRNAAREQPAWTSVHQKMGETLERLGRIDDAYRAFAAGSRIVDGRALPHDESELRTIVENNPDSAPARVALADVLLLRRETTEAEEHLVAAAAADPSNELINRSLAALYLATGRTGEAEARLILAATQRPQRYRSQLALADFLMEHGRYDEARSLLERSLDAARISDLVKLRLAVIDFEQGAAAKALQAVSGLLAAHPTAEAWTIKADFHFRQGERDEALAAAREALTLNPGLAEAQSLIDTIRRQQLRR